MIKYKHETNFRRNNAFYPCLFFIQHSSRIDIDSTKQNDEQLFNDFREFCDHFNSLYFVEEHDIQSFIYLYYTMQNHKIEIPKEEIFNSSFPISLIQSIQQLLDDNPKGDRFLSPYVYALSYIICLNNSYYDDDIIEILLEIINQYANFVLTMLHTLICLIYISQNDKYDQMLFSQIDQLLFYAENLPNLNNSQAIVKFSEVLLNISRKDIDFSYLQTIAQILIQYSINYLYPNDMEGVLCVISQFISISNDYLLLMVESGLIQNLPYDKKNYAVINIIDQLMNAQCFDDFLFDENIINQILDLFNIKIYEENEDLKIKCINILSNLIYIINNQVEYKENVFFPLLKSKLIIQKLCDDVKNASFKLKISINQFLINLIFTKDIEIINERIDEDIIEFIVETGQMSASLSPQRILSSLSICIDVCKDEYLKELLMEKMNDFENYEYVQD